ncbi:hypothetical protein ACIBSV_46200, partial [Embleya sp. NPDC050154]|uniref:hypothetical protein n=1 Tax=Embleya sp. NPDC050154 TaxID=3363988 RepID=UPI00378829F0
MDLELSERIAAVDARPARGRSPGVDSESTRLAGWRPRRDDRGDGPSGPGVPGRRPCQASGGRRAIVSSTLVATQALLYIYGNPTIAIQEGLVTIPDRIERVLDLAH